MMGDVTVVIPHIDSRHELLTTRVLPSVWAQTLPANQIIIQRAMPGEGAAETRNRAIQSVSTKWIAWLDDDDEFLPHHLEILIGCAYVHDADLAYSCMEAVGGRDPLATMVNGALVNPCGVPFRREQERHLRRVGNFIPVTYLVRTEMVRTAGGFPIPYSDEWPRDCEDYGLLIRMLDHGAKFVHAPHVTWRYYFHDANTGGLPK